jgi:hypothetical protein
MRKLITLLIGCSLALTVATQAKKPDDGTAKKPKNVQKQQVAPRQQQQVKAPKQHQQFKAPNANANVNAGPKNKVKVHRDTPNYHSANVNPAKIQKKELHEQQKDLRKSNAVTPNYHSANVNPAKIQKKELHEQEKALRKNQKTIVNTQQNQIKNARLDQQTITRIKAQHHNFHAKPNTSVASVQFNQNYQIQKAQNWNGANYQVFRSYRPQWHDRGWWSTHHNRISLIGGGWYFWNAGYWYPAWGYDESASYYPYDGPIYSGPSARPFDQVVADVQAALQEQGYYRGEVDGLLGPLTREALAEYQSANGLYATETIDRPTLESLGMS